MSIVTQIDYLRYSDMLAFIGNSLLKPMTQTQSVGLDPLFWKSLPDFGEDGIGEAISLCESTVERIGKERGKGAVEAVSVEYTRLFVGPPSPAAPPWETMYRGSTNVGFGEATFEMRNYLHDLGLELSNENRQYEDHMGIELLYLSELCRRVGEGDGYEEQARSFVVKHPLSWIDAFLDRIEGISPQGYFSCLVRLEKALLLAC
ncbi:molecular chaperone [uncultured Ellagibacter sp.]|uniref:TorD/DmsD family molecular chaperone n=1 Tax=uncultured Ellagibacter sp. TaxID=2137580 RepID=UPI002616D092|nr:molecular chaperone TorD family protein [uncultured Ellagibacter sp.]